MEKLNKKILIVEDDEDFSFILNKKFTMEGFTVVAAKDGQEGITLADSEKPDLIFSDMLMPRVDGITMAKKIRETNKEVPIIFLTNLKDLDSTITTQTSNKFDYLIKADTRISDIVQKAKDKLGLK